MKDEVIVIGAGLSGLASAIRLLQAGKNVRVLEKSQRAGGNLRTIEFQGSKFDVGCNDFGAPIETEMKDLGIDIQWLSVNHQLRFSHTTLKTPLDMSSLWSLLYPKDLITLWYQLTYKMLKTQGLVELVSTLSHPNFINMVYGIVSYPLFRPPKEITLSLAGQSLVNEFGYDSPRVPVDGTQSIIQKMLDRIKNLGGTVEYGVDVQSITGSPKNKDIQAKKNKETITYKGSAVVDSVNGWKQYPEKAKPSLAVSAFLFKMKKGFAYPEGVHTIAFMPDDVKEWLDHLENNTLIDSNNFMNEFGFHAFRNYTSNPSDPVAITVYMLTPRGMENISDDHRYCIQNFIAKTISGHIPDFFNNIEAVDFYDPKRYFNELNITPSPAKLLNSETNKISITEGDGIYLVGNAVNDAYAQHAGGSLQSVARAMSQLLQETFDIKPAVEKQDESKKAAPTNYKWLLYSTLLAGGGMLAYSLFPSAWKGMMDFFIDGKNGYLSSIFNLNFHQAQSNTSAMPLPIGEQFTL